VAPVAIEARALTRTFGTFTAVDQVSFSVLRGEIFGFLGPNGAGRTTTLKMLTGRLQPTAGEGWVAGLAIADNAAAIRRRIGYMSQKFSLYSDLTVAENLELFAGLYGVTGARLAARRAWALEMAGLIGQERRLTAELPLGWKQRLALGCAVLHEPEILFLDEPTSGVDPLARRAFWDLIRALAGAGTTVLVSTHYMEEAEYCDRLILMNRARLIAEGTPAALRANLAEPIYRLEVEDAPRAVQALLGAPGVADASIFGRAVHVVLSQVIEQPASGRADATDATDARESVGSPGTPGGMESLGLVYRTDSTENLDSPVSPGMTGARGQPDPPASPATSISAEALTALLAAHGLVCHGIRRISPSLEDVFVSLVRRAGGAVEG
jgi:ABC-2 type transport system ATP-binding protein